MEQKENAIIIDGIKHVLMDNERRSCTICSLATICCEKMENKYICYEVFGYNGKHFEIKK